MLVLMASMFWIGLEVAGRLRFIDGLIMLFVSVWCLSFKRLPPKQIIGFLVFLFWIVTCALVGVISGGGLELDGYFLTAKLLIHVVLMIAVWNVMTDMEAREISALIKILLYAFFFLSVWAIFYVIFYDHFFVGMHPRPSFPLVKGEGYSDAHLLGGYLALSLVFLLVIGSYALKGRRVVFLLVLVSGVLAVIATGSRTALLVTTPALLLGFARGLGTGRLMETIVGVRSIFACAIFLSIILLVIFSTALEEMLGRMVSFDLDADSESVRVEGFLTAFSEADGLALIFGKSPLLSEQIYFDGTLTFLVRSFGLVGVLFFLGLIFYSSIIFLLRGYFSYLIIFCALCSLFAAEYFLIGRWFVPVFFYFCIARRLEIIVGDECRVSPAQHIATRPDVS
jgi:hypothetical protein